jgi:hypothetical protein
MLPTQRVLFGETGRIYTHLLADVGLHSGFLFLLFEVTFRITFGFYCKHEVQKGDYEEDIIANRHN